MPPAVLDLSGSLWATTSATAPIAPSDRYGSMALFFFIALIIMLPFAVRRLRRVLADRPARSAELGTDVGAGADRGAGEVFDDGAGGNAAEGDAGPDRADDGLESVVASITAGAAALGAGPDAPGEITIVVPRRAMIDGRETDETVTAMLVNDAVRRSGLDIANEQSDADRRTLTCRLATAERLR